MTSDNSQAPLRALVAGILAAGGLLGTAVAHAQYKWIDENGRVVYSDRPPVSAPSQITTLRPLPRPPAQPAASPAESPAAAPTSAPPGSDVDGRAVREPTGGRTLVEREQAMRKRLQEREKAERKAEDDARRAAELARACQDRAADLRVLESGMRVVTVDGRGERSFMTDEQIAGRVEALRKAIGDECRRGG